jgi:Ca2+-binding RTX toxin-like protein
VFQDDDSDFRYDAPIAGSGGDQPSDQVSKTWVAAGQGTRTVRLDMETDPDSDNVDENGDCDGDRSAPIDESGWNERARPNQVARNSSHKVCAERFSSNGTPQSGPVTFRSVSGPGHFTDPSGESDFGSEFVAGEDTQGYNVGYLSSIETGETVVEASAQGTSDTGTKPWTAGSGTARNITLEPETASTAPGEEHEVTATVVDKFGNPTEGVTVTFSESGAGRFVEGGSRTPRQTDDDGRATARTTTGPNEEGEQTITASLDMAQTECDEQADRPEAGDPAGNCSDTVTKSWQRGDPQPDQCDQPRVICGDDGDNTIVGTEGDDIILAFGGDDTVDALGGDDVIRLGSGNDVGIGGEGDDIIRGSSGDDTLRGGGGRDFLRGGIGKDTINGNDKNDVLRGGSGADVIRGNKGFDNIRGGRGRDTLRGGRGRDTVRGDRGHDSLFGNRGHDTLHGGPGRDTCRGGRGRDRRRSC